MLKFADRFLSVFFPKRCKYCGELIVPEKDVCETCESSLPRILSPCCPFCGHSKEDCSCKQAKSEYTAVAAPFYYEGAAKTAIHRLKFEGKDFVARTLAQDMAKTVKEQYGEKEPLCRFQKPKNTTGNLTRASFWQNGSARSFVCRVGRCS